MMFSFARLNLFPKKLLASPALVRALPLCLFIIITSLQGRLGEESKYWCYLTKSILGIWLLLAMRPAIAEMRWSFSWEAVLVGIAVCAMWVGIDGLYPHIGSANEHWNPHLQFGRDSALAWFFILARILCTTIIVPPLEEVFYRSFLYRYIIAPKFLQISFTCFDLRAFLFSAVIFGLSHSQWLAGILCAFAYQWLVLRKNRLGDAMTARAITNFLLGAIVAWKGLWQFW